MAHPAERSGREQDGPFRIWYQSFVDPAEQAPYIDRLQGLLDDVAGPGISFAVHGLSPPDRHFHPLTEFRCAMQTVRHALAAQEAGFSAFAIGHFQEPGLLERRASLDIPVVALGEAALLAACTMGRKIGLVIIDPRFVPWHEEQVVRHGLGHRVVAVRAIHADLDTFMKAFTDEPAYKAVRAEFVAQVEPMLALGVEVVIPAGGLPMMLFARERDFTIDGALVLNGIAVVAKAAETAVALHRLTGAVTSRRGTYAKPSPAALAEFMSSRW